MLTGIGLTAVASPALAASSAACLDPVVWVSSGDYATPGGGLRAYAIDPATGAIGAVTQEVTLDRSFGDIAITSDGATLYGVTFDAAPELFTIDATDGSAVSLGPIEDSDGTVVTGLNALTVTPDGELYAGSSNWRNVWTLDPATGILALPYFLTLPLDAANDPLSASGDILTLADGSLLVAALDLNDPAQGTFLVRVAPGSSTPEIVGTMPMAFGMAQSNGWIYFAREDGDLAYLAASDVPTTPSEAPIAFTGSVATGLDLWGATATGDVALGCPPATAPTPDPGPELAATGWDPSGFLLGGAGLLLVAALLVPLRRRAR